MSMRAGMVIKETNLAQVIKCVHFDCALQQLVTMIPYCKRCNNGMVKKTGLDRTFHVTVVLGSRWIRIYACACVYECEGVHVHVMLSDHTTVDSRHRPLYLAFFLSLFLVVCPLLACKCCFEYVFSCCCHCGR